jgi:hypothetical protein
MHAKMTRDRKKNYIAAIEETIDKLVKENDRIRLILTKVATNHVTPMTSPELTNIPSPDDVDQESVYSGDEMEGSPRKRRSTPHGFSLDD